MVLCPIAIAVGCRKCPAFSVCPVKSVIGDYKPNEPDETPARAKADKPAAKTRARTKSGSNRKGARARRPRK